MRVEAVERFEIAHTYPPGKAPADEHPERYGPMKRHWCCRIDGVYCIVHSTDRAKDGWSYNVVEQRDRPAWVGYYHHQPSGRRIRAANSPNALQLAQLMDAY